MSPRPLRQFYGHDRRLVIEGLVPPAEPFRRHRARFLGALATLTEDEWSATTRCDAWNAKDVARHLVSADGFWSLTLSGRTQPEPTTYLRGFDPTTTPNDVIASKSDEPSGATLDALTASTEQLTTIFDAIGDDEWALVSESPMGHVPVRVIAAHALWDSWLHERDVLLPLGHTPPVEDDELVTAAAFTLFLGGAQGGLLDDPDAVADGPAASIAATVAFDELPGRALRVEIDRDVIVAADGDGAAGDALNAGSAVEFVEAVTGRAPADAVLDRLPADLADQLRRARQIL